MITEIPSPNRTKVDGKRSIDLLVLHTMEAPEKPNTAEAVGHYFQSGSVKASSHYGFDSDSTCRYVQENDVAWAAPGANHDGIQFEFAGYSAQSAKDWDDDYSKAMLDRSVEIAAAIVKKYWIPVVFLRAPALAVQKRGITTHRQVSDAFHLSNHTDPGGNFPIDAYLSKIRKAVGIQPGPLVKEPPPTLKKGATGWRVKQLQRLLLAAGHGKGGVDGVFGDTTEAMVREFQKFAGIKPDGIVGPLTWSDLWQFRYLGHV